jgi:hypothetical protein
MAESHLSDQMLKSEPVNHRGSRLSQILINDYNARSFPPQRDGSLAQAVLARGAFRIFGT